VLGQHASDHVFIDVDAERFVDLLRDPGVAKLGITLFYLNNDANEIIRGGLLDPAFCFSVMRINDDSCGLIEHDETWLEWQV
jgi:hypothetical protein